MVRLFLVALVAMTTNQALASHSMSCEVNARVEAIQHVATFATETIYNRAPDHLPRPSSNYTVVISLGRFEVVADYGATKCRFPADQTVELIVSEEDAIKFHKAQLVQLEYSNFGDSMTSKVLWKFRE